MSDIAIRVEHLSKRYRIGRAQRRHDTLRDALADAQDLARLNFDVRCLTLSPGLLTLTVTSRNVPSKSRLVGR